MFLKLLSGNLVLQAKPSRPGNIKSIKNVIPKTGDNIWVDEQSTIKQKIQDIIKKKVSSGKW